MRSGQVHDDAGRIPAAKLKGGEFAGRSEPDVGRFRFFPRAAQKRF